MVEENDAAVSVAEWFYEPTSDCELLRIKTLAHVFVQSPAEWALAGVLGLYRRVGSPAVMNYSK